MEKGVCFGLLGSLLGALALDGVANMGKRVLFKWTMSISKSKMERIGTLFWLQIREVEVVSMQCNCYFV